MSQAPAVALGLVAVAALAALDYAVGSQLGLSLFYAIPVFLVARRAGLRAGLLLAASAALAWGIADAAAGATYPRPWLHYWNTLTRLGYFGMTVAVARMRSGLRLEADQARRDPLTGLLNRRGFEETARREVDRARRYGRPLTLAYLDCDDLKAVNDGAGHAAGDRLLQQIAAVMAASSRTLDVPARLGGDEFVLLLPETGSPEAREALERLREGLHRELAARGWPVTVSVGVVTFVDPPRSVEAILQAGDVVMYRAKQRGKGLLELDVVGGADAGHGRPP